MRLVYRYIQEITRRFIHVDTGAYGGAEDDSFVIQLEMDTKN